MLPGAFPNLLANGSSGIAVGMATSIPPHNAAELCDAALHLIKFPNATVDKLVQLVPGPDFPTGGIIVDDRADDPRGLQDRARLLPRARALDAGGTGPRRLADRRHRNPLSGAEGPADREASPSCSPTKKLPLLADLRDESAEDIRLVFEPKSRTVDPQLLMEQLFRTTELEARIPLNMNVLSRGRVPKVHVAARRAARMARPPQGRARPPHQFPPRRDRPPARDPRRLSHRLSQSRRGDPHHPRRRTSRSPC